MYLQGILNPSSTSLNFSNLLQDFVRFIILDFFCLDAGGYIVNA
jgi:hypothetical protein